MSFLDVVLDASIIRSFDRTGFERHARTFKPGDVSVDLQGKVAIVTGANSGLGLATTFALVARRARVIMACRSAERGRAALERIKDDYPFARVEVAELDVSVLAEVAGFCRRVDHPVDILVNNAGVLPDRRILTTEGHELTFATNVLGPFALVSGLRHQLEAAHGRVITVSSGGMYAVRLAMDVLTGEVERFDGVQAYAQTKRAQVILNELWAEEAPGIHFSAMHPGWADTPAVRSSLPRFYSVTRAILRTPEQGADTIVYLAVNPGVAGLPSGRFFFDRKVAPTTVVPWTRETGAERALLWQLCTAAARSAG